MDLYIDETKLNDEIKAHFAENSIAVRPYNDIYEDVKNLKSVKVLLLTHEVKLRIYNNIPEGVEKIEHQNPKILMKAMKNEVEV